MQRNFLRLCYLSRPFLIGLEETGSGCSQIVRCWLSHKWGCQGTLQIQGCLPHEAFLVGYSSKGGKTPRRSSTGAVLKQKLPQVAEDKKSTSNQRINEQITHASLRVVFPDGTNQILPRSAALKAATDSELDIVEVDSRSNPPVARLCNQRREKYLKQKKQEEADKLARQKRKLETPKELRFTTVIGDHDLEIRLKKAIELLEEGRRVQITVEYSSDKKEGSGENKEGAAATSALDYITARLADHGDVMPQSKQMVRNSVLAIIKPHEAQKPAKPPEQS